MTTPSQEDRHVGVLGLGRMGSALALRLLSSGYRVTVYNRSTGPIAALSEAGAAVAATPASAAEPGGCVITCLTDAEAVRELALGDDGFVRTLGPRGLHLSMSTLSPVVAEALAAAHAECGTAYLSAPIQGRPEAAKAGQLTAWVSGESDALERARPILQAVAARIYWLGESVKLAPGAKLAINFLMFSNVELMAEAFNYVQHCGIDRSEFGKGLTETIFGTPLFRSIADGLIQQEHRAAGSDINLTLKDLTLLAGHASGIGAAMPAADVIRARYELAAHNGLGARAQTAIVMALSGSDAA